LSKSELLLEKINTVFTNLEKTTEVAFFETCFANLKEQFAFGELEAISSESLPDLKEAFNYLLLEYWNSTLQETSRGTDGHSSPKGVVIDVTDQ
jgi:hypothetical protein